MASLNDYADQFLDSDLLFCTVTCCSIFLLVFLDPWFFCDGPEDDDLDQLEDEDYVSNAPFYFSSLFFCVSCFLLLLGHLRFDVAVLAWVSELPSEDYSVVAIPLLLGALGVSLVLAQFQRGDEATLPLAGKHLLGERDGDASPLEVAIENSVLHCTVISFAVAIKTPTLPFQLVKALCKPLVTYIYGPLCDPGELPVPHEAYNAIVRELRNKTSELRMMRTQNEELKSRIESDQLEHETELNLARLKYEDLELRLETEELKHQLSIQEERQLSSALTQLGVGRDTQKMMAMIHSLALLNTASETNGEDNSGENASLDAKPVIEPSSEAPGVEQKHDIDAAENVTALDGELAREMAAEELAAVVAAESPETEESGNNKMDEGDNAWIDDSVTLHQPTSQEKARKKNKKKKQRAGRDIKAREGLKEVSQRLEALNAQKQVLEASWAERCKAFTAKAPAIAVNASLPAVSATVPVQQHRPAVNTVQHSQQASTTSMAAVSSSQAVPMFHQFTQQQGYKQTGGQYHAPDQLFQPTQQQSFGLRGSQHEPSDESLQPPQPRFYGLKGSRHQPPSPY